MTSEDDNQELFRGSTVWGTAYALKLIYARGVVKLYYKDQAESQTYQKWLRKLTD